MHPSPLSQSAGSGTFKVPSAKLSNKVAQVRISPVNSVNNINDTKQLITRSAPAPWSPLSPCPAKCKCQWHWSLVAYHKHFVRQKSGADTATLCRIFRGEEIGYVCRQ